MKLLFDENVSPRLPRLLAAEYPGSVHVDEAGLHGVADKLIWDYALEHGFTIISKDTDFRERSQFLGSPPKVIWLDVGNAGTLAIASLLQEEQDRLRAFESQEESAFLILSLGPYAV